MKSSKKPKTKCQLCQCLGLLRCQSVKSQCNVIHNRDKNAVQNMLNIVQSIFNTGKRLFEVKLQIINKNKIIFKFYYQ
jgi:hypothetical protein